MDTPRAPRRSVRWRPAALVAGLAAAVAVGLAVGGERTGGPSTPLRDVLVDTVRRGDLVREIRGSGTLAPERLRWITAQASARVDRIAVQSGATVAAGDPLLVLANPDVEVQALQAEQQLSQAEAALADLRIALQGQILGQEGSVAAIETQALTTDQEARAAEALLRQDLISRFDAAGKRALAAEFATRLRVERERLRLFREALDGQLARQARQVERWRAIADFQRGRVRALMVQAPEAGVVQDLALQPGQWVTEGTPLAKVMQPGRLKALLRIAESQAKDVLVGQAVSVDTRNGVVRGRVARKDPAAQSGIVMVEVALTGALPAGAVPDLMVDGVIEIERVAGVLSVGRPALPVTGDLVRLFRVEPDGRGAVRVPVRLGRSSLLAVEIVSGLRAGDVVILSDLPEWGGQERIRLR